ncbi:chromosome segregation protein SMC, partial [Candidatus Woesearchaeota archaeon CG_4_10_14_0_2_um_filter_57_5]
AEKSANLIYNGGRARQPHKQAEVSIFFDNEKKAFPIQGDEIKITRLVRQDGQSKYKINDQTRSRQEVLDLMSRANIDPNGFNIVLQGDIQGFVNSTTTERRKIIEDIAGIGVYEEKKEKAARELDRVEERLREAEIILAEKSKHLKELKADRDQAMKYKELSEKIKVNKASFLWRQIKGKHAEQAQYDKLLGENQEKITKLRSEIETLRKQNEDKKTEIRKIVQDIEEKGQKEQLDLNHQIEELKVQIALNKNRLEEHERESSKIKERNEQLTAQMKENKERQASLEKELKDQERSKEQAKKELESMQTKITEFRKKHGLDSQHEIDNDMEELDRQAEQKQEEIGKLREQQQQLMREKDRLELRVQQQDEQIAKVSEIEKEQKTQLDGLREKKTEFKRLTLELNRLLSEDSSLLARLRGVRESAQKMHEEKGRLEIRAASMRERQAGDRAVRAILENRSLGDVYGTVSDIGHVDAQYSTALSVAAGSRIKSIVVKDDAVAAKCIKYLRSEQLGVASFIPMNKIRPRKDDDEGKHRKADGVIGRAVDLIDYDAKFKKVFEYVFGSTLVVKSIETARRLGIGTARMVSLDGDLVETSGAMIGGYRKRESKGFQEKGVLEELNKVSAECSAAEAEEMRIQQEREDLEKTVQELRGKKAELEGDVIKMERSMHLEGSDLEASMRQKELLKKDTKDIDTQLDAVLEQVSDMNRELAQIKLKKSSLREKVGAMRKPTVLAELSAFEEKRRELAETAAGSEAEAKGKRMQLDSVVKPELVRLEHLAKDLEKETGRFTKGAKDAKESLKTQEKEIKEKEVQAKKFYEEFKENIERKGKIQDEITKNEEQVFRREEKSRQFEQTINKAGLDVAQIRGALAGLAEQFNEYKDVKIDEHKPETQLKKEINEFEGLMANIGSVNLRALDVYDEAEQEFNKLTEKKDTLRSEKDSVLEMMTEIETRKKDLFMGTFEKLNSQFMAFFQELSPKGEAFLEVENPVDPFLEGVTFKVRITGNKFLDIRSLSGGEKTLTSLAFLFAIQEFEPASFYVMDEVDAALDNLNSEKLAKLVRKYTKTAQYIVVSHNESVIKEADTLFGVSMGENNISRLVSLKA